MAYSQSSSKNVDVEFSAQSLTVWHVGSDNDLIRAILDKLQAQGASVNHFNDFPLQITPSDKTLVVFDGDWISNTSSTYKCRMFLQMAYKSSCLVAVGGATSGLLNALDKAEVYRLGRDEDGNIRNPAHSNPSASGFKLKTATTPTGEAYTYPSIFISDSKDVNVITEALINWLGG